MIAVLLCSPICAQAGMIFDFVPSNDTNNVNGIEFSPNGGDLTVTNTLVSQVPEPISSPTWLDFRVIYDHKDDLGNVFYKPNNSLYQVYVLTDYLPVPPGTVTNPVVATLMDGNSEAYNLGNGRYEYKANVVGGNIDLTFNTNLPLGHQVESGTFTYDPTTNATPEPASIAMMGIGVILAGLARRYI